MLCLALVTAALAGALAVLPAPDPIDAAPRRPPSRAALKLTCTTVRGDGQAVTLPAKKLRIEAPVDCTVQADAAGRAVAVRVTSKGRPVSERSGATGADRSFRFTLVHDVDFETCLSFAIAAVARDASGQRVGATALAVAQWCPD